MQTLTSFNLDTVQVELSSKCTLKCPRCPRTELNLPYLNQEIKLDTFKQCFTPKVLSYIKTFLFIGHTGDPIYATDLLEICEYVKLNSKTAIRIVTNGSYKKNEWWIRLGTILDNRDAINFSIDGYDNQSNNLYRIDSDWNSIISAIKLLKQHSTCLVNWSTIYFRFNQDKIDAIKKIANELKCDEFILVKSSKFDGRYTLNGVDNLKPNADFISESNNYERIKFVLNRKDTFQLEQNLSNHVWAKCLNHNKEINVTVEGMVYPCGWFNTGYQDNHFVKKYKDRLSIHNRNLLDILQDNIWAEFINDLDRYPLDICKIKCKNDR